MASVEKQPFCLKKQVPKRWLKKTLKYKKKNYVRAI